MQSDSPSVWKPPTFPRQNEIRWAVHPDNPKRVRDLCVSGPRHSSKTVGCMHALVEHAWEVDHALIAIVSPTVTSATDGGCWQKLVEETIPAWIEGDFGLTWHRKPYQESVSKRIKCSIRNKHGTISVFQLESFREGATETDIGIRFKNKEFSCIYFSEAGTWIKTQAAYDILTSCFRLKQWWTENQFTMILDTNPEPPGEDHWIFQLFYRFRTMSEADLIEMIADKPIRLADMIAKQKRMGLVEVFVSDNLSLSEATVADLKTKYAHSPDLWARYWEGKWTSASGDGLFFDVFRPAIHCLGEIETPMNPEPAMLLPYENAHELFTGLDPGSSNYAWTIVERFYWPDSTGKSVPHFNVIDELVELGCDLSIGDITQEFLLKMDFWNQLHGQPLHWVHYSDNSAFNYRESIANRAQHVEVYNVSKGRIKLNAVEKRGDSVRQRVDILRKLLHQDRIFFSRTKCPLTIAAIQGLKKGKNTPLDRNSPFKHAVDALTYVLASLCYEELFRVSKSVVAKPSSTSHISLNL